MNYIYSFPSIQYTHVTVSPEESRQKTREAFRKRKQEKRYNEIRNCKKSSFKCEKCEFTGKTEGGLKKHQRVKHKVP